MLSFSIGSLKLFSESLDAIQVEEFFEIDSEYTSAALKMATALQVWQKECSDDHSKMSWFAHMLTVRLGACFLCCCHTRQLRREKKCGELTTD